MWLNFLAKSIFIFNYSPIFIYSFYLFIVIFILRESRTEFHFTLYNDHKGHCFKQEWDRLEDLHKYICTKGSKTPQKLKWNYRIMTVALTVTHHFHDDADGLSDDSLVLSLLCPQMM